MLHMFVNTHQDLQSLAAPRTPTHTHTHTHTRTTHTHLVPVGDGLNLPDELVLWHGAGQAEVPAQLDLLGHGGVGQLVEGAVAELLEHGHHAVLSRADVPGQCTVTVLHCTVYSKELWAGWVLRAHMLAEKAITVDVLAKMSLSPGYTILYGLK